MGAVFDGLADTGRVVTEHPLVLLAAVVTGVVVPVVSFLLGLIPVLGPIVYFVLVQPVFIGGLLAMSVDAADGDVSLDSYVQGISDNYTSLAGVYAILVGIIIAFAIVAAVLAVVFGVAGALGGAGAGSGADAGVGALAGALGGFALVGLFSLLTALVVAVVVQFVEAAVVVGDAGAGEAYSESYRMLRTNPLSVLGYSLVRLLFYLLVQAVPIALLFGVTALAGSDSGSAVGTVVLVVLAALGVLGYVGLTVYHALYYRRLIGGDDRSGGGSQSTAAGGSAAARDPLQDG
jgi:hypothetical protein